MPKLDVTKNDVRMATGAVDLADDLLQRTRALRRHPELALMFGWR